MQVGASMEDYTGSENVCQTNGKGDNLVKRTAPHGREEYGRRALLSKAHIRPQFKYIDGASRFTATKGEKQIQVGGGKRGPIKGFSVQSRRRLLYTIAKIKREAELPCFVTLTYPGEFPTVERAKRDKKVFEQRLVRAFGKAGLIWKLEPQQRGAPHYHLLVWGVEESKLFGWTLENWFEIAGNGDINHLLFHAGALRGSEPCVQKVRSWRGVWSYASKYLGKTFEVAEWGNKWTGRFWGVVKPENIPFGEEIIIDVPLKEVIVAMRYQRRFSGIKRSGNSLTIFCDATQWAEKLGLIEDRYRHPALA